MQSKTWLIVLSVISMTGAMTLAAQARQKVDTNGDGTITASEITTAYANDKPKRIALFQQLDTNHDGVLTENEVGPQAMKTLDLNKDGKITENEFLAAAAKQTSEKAAQLDTNGNGQIDPSEKQSAIDRWKAKHGQQ